jgi:outer membrane protein
MRVRQWILPVLLILALAPSAEAQEAIKIGYIDSQAIIDQDPAAQEAQKQFEEDMTRYRAEVQQLGEEIQNLIDQYNQQQAMLSEAAKANRQEEIRLKQTQYQQRISELEQQANMRSAELIQPVMERINSIIEEIRTAGSYAMIFDVAAQGVIAADPELDLTPEVIRRLQAGSGGQGGSGGGGAL